jgi:hypothetical protein
MVEYGYPFGVAALALVRLDTRACNPTVGSARQTRRPRPADALAETSFRAAISPVRARLIAVAAKVEFTTENDVRWRTTKAKAPRRRCDREAGERGADIVRYTEHEFQRLPKSGCRCTVWGDASSERISR